MCCSRRHTGRTKKRLSDIRKRLDSLETLVQKHVQQQNDSMQRICDLLQTQHPPVVADDDLPAQRTVTFHAETNESLD